MLKRQSCGDGRGRERERDMAKRRGEQRRREGRGEAGRPHAQLRLRISRNVSTLRSAPRSKNDPRQRSIPFDDKRTLLFTQTIVTRIRLQRAPLDRRPDGFLINVCKFLARSKIFLPHSCNNFHTCSIFVPRPKQIYIQQIFANIQSKLVRFEMRDRKKKRRKKRSIGF